MGTHQKKLLITLDLKQLEHYQKMNTLMDYKLTYMIWYATSNLRTVSLEFQSNLSKDIKRINEDPLLFTPNEKTNNLNKLS